METYPNLSINDPEVKQAFLDAMDDLMFGLKTDLEADGYTLIEKRPDLTYWKFNEEATDSNKTRFINHCREVTTSARAQSDNMNCNVLSGDSIFTIQWYDTETFKNYNGN